MVTPSNNPVETFINAGLPKAKAEQAAKTPKVADNLLNIILSAGIASAPATSNDNPKQGTLLLHLATVTATKSELDDEAKTLLAKGISEGRLQTQDQLNAGIDYLKAGGDRSPEKLDKACGVGIIVSAEDVASKVQSYMTENAASLAATTWASLASAMASLKVTEELRWASPLAIKQSLESAFTTAFGTKEEYNKVNAAAAKASKGAGSSKTANGKASVNNGKNAEGSSGTSSEIATSATKMFQEGFLAKLHPVGGNPQLHPHLREEHLKATQGLVHTRFPPEPNGYLHIGHSKAIAINFGFAQYHGGRCYLRFDDTNPETEDQEYIDSALDIIRWLGFEPWKITYSSDHFQKLYELAVELIKRDKAYMCYCTADQIAAGRGTVGETDGGPRFACEHRSMSVQESLDGFERMKRGEFGDKDAVLRMKQDLENPSPQMWDLIAYRTPKNKRPHHRTGSEWLIYPTYDFTHCLCDSFENITHSLCTTEFVLSRQSYEWLCDALEVYKPKQSEYGRLKLQGTFLSKRKIMRLVEKGLVSGWDDPRLYTLIAQRRRGVPPGAILSFINGLGVTTAESTLGTHRYEQAVRAYLETSTPRLMLVLNPLKVTLENVPEDYVEFADKPLHPKNPSLGTNTVPLTRTVYIDKSDFRTQDSKEFFRLAPGKTVGLLYASYPITCTSYRSDEVTGEVVEVFARYEGFTADPQAEKAPAKKVKTYIHWVGEHPASNSPVHVKETRIFGQLFKSDDPATIKDYESDVDPDSLRVVRGAYLETGIWDVINHVKRTCSQAEQDRSKLTSDPSATLSGGTFGGNERVRFQGLRTAYFCLDKEAKVQSLKDGSSAASEGPSPGDALILNWIVSLKEDKAR